MQTKFLAVVASAVLLTFAPQASAGPPIKNFGGCNASWSIYFFDVTQTFVPTFSVLKQARVPLANPNEPEALLRVHVYEADGDLVAISDYAVLPADTSGGGTQADAVAFKFGGGVGVTPGDSYILRLERVAGGNASMCAIASNPYADGALAIEGGVQTFYDLAFGLIGGGPAK